MNLFKKLSAKKNSDCVTSREFSHVEKSYYEEACDWRYQMYHNQSVWLNRSLLVVASLSVLLFLSLIANLFLFPLKQNVPFLYTVNETTGEITQLGQLNPNKLNQNDLMTRFLLIRYVTNRESYDADNLEQPYQIAWAMSDSAIATEYSDEVRTDNKSSPFALYGKNKYITVHVLSISTLNDQTNAVRFEQTLHDRNSGTEQTVQKESIVKWRYTEPETTEKALDRDPLGFKVTYYRSTQLSLDK